MRDLSTLIATWRSVRDFGAVGDGVTNDAQAFEDCFVAAALAGVPAFVPGGREYRISSLVTLPTTQLQVRFGPGAKITTGSGAFTMFKIPDGLAERTHYDFYNAIFDAESVADQIFMEIADSESLGVPRFYDSYIEHFNTVFNVTAADLDYVVPVDMYLTDCHLEAAVGLSDNHIVKTVGAAGSFLHGCVLWAHNSFLSSEIVSVAGWTFDAAFDLIGTGTVYMLLVGTNKLDGIDGSVKIYGTGGLGMYDLTMGGGNYWAFGEMGPAIHLSYGTFRLTAGATKICTSLASLASMIVTGPDNTIDIRYDTSVADVGVDVLGDRTFVSGRFGDHPVAAIRLATADNIVTHATFQSTGAHPTVLETGAAADRNVIGPCTGLASGGGVSLDDGNNSYIVEEGLFEGYVVRSNGSNLRLDPDGGNRIHINGEILTIPAAGITVNVGDARIIADGTTAGASLAINTEYYLYVSNQRASFGSNSLRFSTVAPTLYRGVRYLGTSGNARHWRYVGRVRTISNAGNPEFADSVTQRLVSNWYNQRRKDLFVCPGYADDSATTTWSESNQTNWTELHLGGGGPGCHLEYIADGRHAITVKAKVEVYLADPGDYVEIGIADNSATAVVNDNGGPYSPTADFSSGIHGYKEWTPAEGYRLLYLSARCQGPTGSVSFYSDNVRNGAAADPPISWLEASVMA